MTDHTSASFSPGRRKLYRVFKYVTAILMVITLITSIVELVKNPAHPGPGFFLGMFETLMLAGLSLLFSYFEREGSKKITLGLSFLFGSLYFLLYL